MLVAGCGSSASQSSSAPKHQDVAQSGNGSGQAGGVAALAAATPKSLCVPEGGGRPRKQCVAGLSRLSRGKAKNPRAACRGLSKKKTKGVQGKSPYAVCVKAAATLMAGKKALSQNGSAGGTDPTAGDTSTDSTGSADGIDTSGLTCTDANGNPVPADSPDVDSCDDPGATDPGTDTSGDLTSTDGG